jgi:hypothetical protein
LGLGRRGALAGAAAAACFGKHNSDISVAMAKSISDIRVRKKPDRKKPGPPRTTGPGVAVLVRLHHPILGELERWAAKSGVTRAEAIRRLIERALKD